ncbi:MAG: FG-GAP repeat protein, partial [Planctomycetes bacterium]|nr:FG-GAP repeat protein [Planctomycetota bacterium]
SQQAELTASDAANTDFFGWSVSLEGNDALVGAPYQDAAAPDGGAVYVYHFDGASWAQTAKLTASDAAQEDFFGWSVSLHGDYAVIGAFMKNGAGTHSGAAYVFRRSGTGWTQLAKLTAPDAAAGDSFGQSVRLSVPYAVSR